MAKTAVNTGITIEEELVLQQQERQDTEMAFRVSVADLQPGVGGEVVLFNDSAFRDMILESDLGDVQTGSVRSHVTADGIDVSGFRYLRFENGLVVYHAADTVVTVVHG